MSIFYTRILSSMKQNRALINYTSLLEEEETELREILGVYQLKLDDGVTWRFLPCIFDLKDKGNLQTLADYIRKERIEPLKEIEDQIKLLKKEGEKAFFENPKYAEASEFASKYMDNTKFTWDELLEDCESAYESLLHDYEELIELIEYLKE